MTDGETGILVKPGSVDALAEALRETDWEGFEVARLRAAAERFSESCFRERFVAVVSATIAEATHAANRTESPKPASWPTGGQPRGRTGGLEALRRVNCAFGLLVAMQSADCSWRPGGLPWRR